METTDTRRPNILTPEGTHKFTVKEVPLKKPTKNDGQFFYTFKFTYLDGDRIKTHTEFLMPWDLPPLLLAFGFKPEPGHETTFVWDRIACYSPVPKVVTATIVHQTDKKDPSQVRARMTEIKAVSTDEIPF